MCPDTLSGFIIYTHEPSWPAQSKIFLEYKHTIGTIGTSVYLICSFFSTSFLHQSSWSNTGIKQDTGEQKAQPALGLCWQLDGRFYSPQILSKNNIVENNQKIIILHNIIWVQKALKGQSLLGMKQSVIIQRLGSSLRAITIPERILLVRPRFLTTQTAQFSGLGKAGKPTNYTHFCNPQGTELPFLERFVPPASQQPS